MMYCLCVFVGPPETMREHIVAAVKSMKKGDWKKCSEYILAVKVISLASQELAIFIIAKRQRCLMD